MHNLTLDMQIATGLPCARPVRDRDAGYAVRANTIFGAATGGFWALDPHTTKHHHSLRERRT